MTEAARAGLFAGTAVWVMWIGLGIFNVVTLWLLRATTKNIRFKDVLREKNPTTPVVIATVAPAAGAPAAPAPAAAQAPDTSDKNPDETSYSRVAGMVGAIVLACFIWAIGNVTVYEAFADPGAIPALLQNIGGFVLTGATLFAPYAVNQLSAAFKDGNKT